MLFLMVWVGSLCGLIGKRLAGDDGFIGAVSGVDFHIGLVGVCVWCYCWWSEWCWRCCNCPSEGHQDGHLI